MNPTALLSDVSHLQKIRIKTSFDNAFAKGRFMHPGSTGGHNDTVKAAFADVFFDFSLPRIGASVFVSNCNNYPRKRFGC
jgi:hypothetical protein